ncbi:hypothetical protein GGI43DRAFT_89399 [Trichoderma evansii]
MKPSSILLLTAAGLAAALPAKPLAARSEIQDAPVARSFLERAADIMLARDLVPLNGNTAAPAGDAAADAAAKKGAAATTSAAAAAPPAATTSAADDKKGAATTTSAAAAAATTTSAADANNAAAATTAAAAATTVAVAPPAATATNAAAGNGTASAGGKDKGKGKGQGKGQGQDQGKGKGKGKGKGGNNNNGGLANAISGALTQLGLDGVLNASSIDKLSGDKQVALLAQIVTLQTLADLSMVTSKQVVVALNQGFQSSGLNVIINA